jgi:hypothetical protein
LSQDACDFDIFKVNLAINSHELTSEILEYADHINLDIEKYYIRYKRNVAEIGGIIKLAKSIDQNNSKSNNSFFRAANQMCRK